MNKRRVLNRVVCRLQIAGLQLRACLVWASIDFVRQLLLVSGKVGFENCSSGNLN
jgi:hypothetical protein